MSDHRQFTYDDIAKDFEYDPDKGELWRRMKDHLRQVRLVRNAGDKFVAFRTGFRGHQIQVTHVMWMLMTKRWPREGYLIDHKDGDLTNCRWVNFREATHRQSTMNRGPLGRPVSDDDLERGVYPSHNGKYQVQLTVEGRIIYYGTFDTKAEANARAKLIRAALHGDYLAEASRKEEPPDDT